VSGLNVERLTLHVPAMSEADADALAREVARSLRGWPAAGGPSGRIASVSTSVSPPAGETVDIPRLAEQIAASVCRAAARELGQ
jgi:hypothetical protein